MSNLPITYNIAIETPDKQALVDWGNDKDWQQRWADLLAEAERISLIPKEKENGLPVVTVALDDEKRWVVFSRIYGRISGGNGREIRMYCIGWQKTIRGVNEKSLLWVYPSGAVECAELPSIVNLYLGDKP